MEIESPKVQDNVKDEPNKPNELAILVNNVFECDENGKKLFSVLKDLYVSNSFSAGVLPCPANVLPQFGSAEVYMGFREGQKNVIFFLERLLAEYKQMEANKTKPESK